MPYCDVANLVNVTKTNMINEMPCGNGTLRTTGVRIWHQVSHRPAQRSPLLQNLAILIVISRSILNTPPSLQVLSGACDDALAQSESILQSSRGGWEHLEVLRSTRKGYRSVWVVCIWFPDWITFCWWSWMPHQYTFSYCTHRVWTIWDLSNHVLFLIIADPCSQKRITLTLESISTIPFQARVSYVKISEYRQHRANRGMWCLVSLFGLSWGILDQPNLNPGRLLKCVENMFSNIANCKIWWTRMLVTRNIGQVGLIRCTDNWPNCRSGSKLFLQIPVPITSDYLTVYSATFWVGMAQWVTIELHRKREMWQRGCVHLKISL